MIDVGRIQGWVFDIDDTLIRESDYVRSGFAAVDAWLREDKGLVGFLPAALRHFTAGHRGNVFNLVLADLGVSVDQQLIAAMLDCYRNHKPAIKLSSDILQMLQSLSDRKIGVISDGYAVAQARKVEALGLRHFADPIILTDIWGKQFWKPHPRAFEAIEKQWSLPGPALVYVADNPAKDFSTPVAMGWQTIRMRQAGGEHAGEKGTDDISHTLFAPADLTALVRTASGHRVGGTFS